MVGGLDVAGDGTLYGLLAGFELRCRFATAFYAQAGTLVLLYTSFARHGVLRCRWARGIWGIGLSGSASASARRAGALPRQVGMTWGGGWSLVFLGIGCRRFGMEWVLYFVGIMVVLKGWNFLLTVRNLRRIRYKEGGCEVGELEDLPGYLGAFFGQYEGRMEAMGFGFSHCQLIDGAIEKGGSRQWGVVYYHVEKKCWASLTVGELPDRDNPVAVEYSSCFSDGQRLLTVNGVRHFVLGEMPNVRVNDPYASSLEEQFESHLSELSLLGVNKEAVALGVEEFSATEDHAIKGYLGWLIEHDYVRKTKAGNYQLRLKRAWVAAGRMFAGMGKVKRMRQAAKQDASARGLAAIELPAEMEAEAYWRMEHTLGAGKEGVVGNLAILGVSVVLFMVAFKTMFSLYTVMLFVGALFLHEMGHYVGMRLLGYRDVKILFIPFLGAATLGKQGEVTAVKRVVVYLLGPAPGILLGTCLLVFYPSSPEVLRKFAIFLLALNYINLLPICLWMGGGCLRWRCFRGGVF